MAGNDVGDRVASHGVGNRTDTLGIPAKIGQLAVTKQFNPLFRQDRSPVVMMCQGIQTTPDIDLEWGPEQP